MKKIVKTLALKYLFCLVSNIFYIVTFTHLENVNTDDLYMYIIFSGLMHILCKLRYSKNKQQQQKTYAMLTTSPLPSSLNMASTVIFSYLFMCYLYVFYLLCGNLVHKFNSKA